VPGLYILAASAILFVLFAYRPATTWPGMLIVVLGIPIYFVLRGRAGRTQETG
jgi:APA family basic amino acid/polyamine antiporter